MRPTDKRLKRGDPRHGTVGGYTNNGCRCKRCRAAHAEAHRLYMQVSELQERRRRQSAAKARERRKAALAPCGTWGAYQRHLRAAEMPCELCSVAARAYERENKGREVVPDAPHRAPAECGTLAGYARHRHYRQDPCEECMIVFRVHDAQYRRDVRAAKRRAKEITDGRDQDVDLRRP